MTEPELAKLSEAADHCGIPADVLKIMAADDLLPRSSAAAEATCTSRATPFRPTWNECLTFSRD